MLSTTNVAIVQLPLRIVLVGRPNTGKSTLYNRLTGTKMAIVSAVPGTTRDRREGTGYLAGLPLRVVDTGGLDDRGEVSTHIQQQVARAVSDADVVLFMVDSRSGITALDRHFATWLRHLIGTNAAHTSKAINTNVLVIANKAEGAHGNDAVMDTAAEALRFGFGDAVPLSAIHGDGLADLASLLLQEARQRGRKEEEDESVGTCRARRARALAIDSGGLAKHLKLSHNAMPVDERIIQLALMGRPNVGKSTMLNAIVGNERSIAGTMAGLTRDSVHVEWDFADRRFRLVDTAGLTRTRPVKALMDVLQENKRVARQELLGLAATGRSKNTGGAGGSAAPPLKVPVSLPGIQGLNPEEDPSQFSYQVSELALLSALNALRYAQVVCLVIESSQQRFSKIDLQIARVCLQEGRGLVILANKRDLLGNQSGSLEDEVKKHCEQYLPEFGDIPVVATSGLQGQGLRKALHEVIRTHDAWSRRIDTWVLNKWLKDLLLSAAPARAAGKEVKIKYITQTSSRPPEFLLFSNAENLPGFYERFLRKKLQAAFDLPGVPLRFVVRKTAGNIVRKDLLANSTKSRRGTGHGEGRGVGPNKRNVNLGLKRHILGDARDKRRRTDTRRGKGRNKIR